MGRSRSSIRVVENVKHYKLESSGRKSILHGSKFARGFIIRPEQILSLFHDTLPNLPIPVDAEHCGIGIEDAGCDSFIQFYYTSKLNPHEHCFKIKPELFLRFLIDLAHGLIPTDAELDGIEVSHKFTVLLLRLKSSHWPAYESKNLPLVHLRYDLGQLVLCDPASAIEGERRIRVQ